MRLLQWQQLTFNFVSSAQQTEKKLLTEMFASAAPAQTMKIKTKLKMIKIRNKF